jgi:hypothetical protein
MAAAFWARPGASLPVAMGDTAGRESAYRFLSNRRVTLRRVIGAHVEATVARARAARKILVVSDTTEFRFSTEREGLGVLSGQRRDGFIGHFALAVSADGRRTPLGILEVETMARAKHKGERTSSERKTDPARESLRWRRCAETASQRLEGIEAIHVMDREADIYELLSGLMAAGRRFIVRSGQERNVEDGLLSTALTSLPVRFTREVTLSARATARSPQNRRTHPARRTRVAQLAVSTTQVTLRKPSTSSDATLPRTITVNIVRAWEPTPPSGEPPVEWRLFTTEPIETQSQVEEIVDGYRGRWVIEEYFKALKTGCNFERSQLESRSGLENLLGIYVPVAWQLLFLRSVARDQPTRPASDVLSTRQLHVLRLLLEHKHLPANPTVADVASAIAKLGAHITSNGPPGWQVLGRGFEELLRAEQIYLRMIPQTSCDQS